MSRRAALEPWEVLLVDDVYPAMDRTDAAKSCGLPLHLVSKRYDELDAEENNNEEEA